MSGLKVESNPYLRIRCRSCNENCWCVTFSVIHQVHNQEPRITDWNYDIWQTRVLLCYESSSLFCKYFVITVAQHLPSLAVWYRQHQTRRCSLFANIKVNEQTPWLLVHKQTILTERPPLVGEF
jgi:hypothetical protein